MNPNIVFAGVYLLVLGGVIALVGALLGDPAILGDHLTHEAQFGLVIGGVAFQAFGVATAIFGTWYETLTS